jgi:hypothetical protein
VHHPPTRFCSIYKVGAAPYWAGGSNLLAQIGLCAAVIPHYDNAEGGTHEPGSAISASDGCECWNRC